MSRGEILFSPKSLHRVALAVEWEDELELYKDGSTNQGHFMAAMAVLWERWMRGWSIPDFSQALTDARAGGFVDGVKRICSSLPERIAQLKGFYEGLWGSVNPPRKKGAFEPSLDPYDWSSGEGQARAAIQRMFRALSSIVTEEVEG